jgi:PAS domain S-box-containing protein
MKYVSPSVEKAMGYTPEEIMAMPIDQYLTPEATDQALKTINTAMAAIKAAQIDPKNYSVTLELEEYHKNGSIIPIEVTAGFLVDKNGQPEAFLGISRNMSERKEADRQRSVIETKLQQSKKMGSLGTMAGSIAHNFNNLLMVVLGNLELAKEDLPEPSITTTNIQRAINAAQRAADLSSTMLTYVGQLKKESVPVDLSQVVQSVLGNMDESTMANVTVELDLADPMPLVIADADQMRQIISGFVTNAIEALENKNGRVHISTGSMHCDRHYLSSTYLKEEMPEGMYAYVEVADTGCGMDTETMGNVFDPFFSTKFTGRGLGMAAVLGIIRSHGGAIKVSSVKHEGSVFTALFPIQGVFVQQAKSDPLQTAPHAPGKTVLLVDDEAMVMEVGCQFLTRLGYKALEASNGQQALDIFRRASATIDCVLLDYTMPGMDGLETMQQIRKICADVRIVITSGYTRQQIEDRFAEIGPPTDFIQKPFQMKALQEKLNRVISDHHSSLS